MMKRLIIAMGVMLAGTVFAADSEQKNQSSQDLQQIQQLQQTQQRVRATQDAPVVVPAMATSVPQQLPVNNASADAPQPPALMPAGPPATAQAPMASAPPEEGGALSMQDQAFAGVTETMLPMSPAQIRHLRELFGEVQQSSTEIPGVPPKPTSTSIVVNLAPGAAPPVVRLSGGFVTSLVFLDATGAAWPIQAYDIGDPKSFNIQWDKKGNTLLIQAMNFYKQGNLAVMLKDLNTPIMLTLLPGQKAVDYRVDMQIPRMGPNAEPYMSGLPNPANPELLNVLNGMPPSHGQALKVIGGECQAWVTEDKLFLRTPLTVISPSWISTMSGPDGAMHAYELPKASVILALQQGKMVKLILEGF